MQRWILAAVAVAFVGALAVYAIRTTRSQAPNPAPSASSSAPTAVVPVPAAVPRDAGAGDAGLAPPLPSDVPPLPDDAPKAVRFGVILFSYAGAERAPKSARSKAKALELARATLEAAREDFGEAVKRGDPGSTEDAGRIPRGVLEPAIEYALFTLKKGEIHAEPLDTPRGYWIARRAD